MGRPNTWTPDEDALLRTLCAPERRASTAQLMRNFPGRSDAAIRRRKQKLGMATPTRVWTAKDDAYLRANDPRMSDEAIGKKLGRTAAAVYQRKQSAVYMGVGTSSGKRQQSAPQGTRRPCLCCGVPFHSEGIGNRLCPPCRRGERSVAW